MRSLGGKWGERDVEDAVGGAQALCDRNLADPARLAIKGGSAGGYTVLNALIRFPNFFRAGVCLFGVSNLFTLAAETHKFEARYLDSMVGPLPEAAQKYRDWSPIFHVDQIRDPLAVFQGDEDTVVPPEQSATLPQRWSGGTSPTSTGCSPVKDTAGGNRKPSPRITRKWKSFCGSTCFILDSLLNLLVEQG
jgi:Dipeptidyl aminopeptidases/acylaminoacyl-peptidases